jgi:hypothetical protein
MCAWLIDKWYWPSQYPTKAPRCGAKVMHSPHRVNRGCPPGAARPGSDKQNPAVWMIRRAFLRHGHGIQRRSYQAVALPLSYADDEAAN